MKVSLCIYSFKHIIQYIMNIMNNNIIVSIEGNIGSGKSTLLTNLKQQYKTNDKIIFVDEPVKEWSKIRDADNKNIIEKFYENTEKYSFPFQMLAYISRLKAFMNILQNVNNKIIISERSLYTDEHVFAKMLYDTNKMDHISHKIYLQWVTTFSTIKTHKIIYVRTLPTICHLRILTRNREGENINMQYVNDCHTYHDDMIKTLSNDTDIEIMHLDGNVGIYKFKFTSELWKEKTYSFLKLNRENNEKIHEF